jgi:hypothetical protein
MSNGGFQPELRAYFTLFGHLEIQLKSFKSPQKQYSLLVGLALCGLIAPSQAQIIVSKKPLNIGVERQHDWLTEKWSGDESAYRKIRTEIDMAFAQKKVSKALVDKYDARAKMSPFNPLERFGQIYID